MKTVNRFEAEETQAICESATSERVVKFIPKNDFSEVIQKELYGGNIWGVYYDESGKLVAQDIWGKVHENVLAG